MIARRRLALAGDSLTHFGPWPQLLPEFDTINFGVSGNTTGQLADRLDPVLQCAPDAVSLLIGTNDIGLQLGAPPGILVAVTGMIDVLAPVTRVALTTVPPRQAEFSDELTELNDGLRQLAKATDCLVVELWPLFDDGRGVLRHELTTDGLHLNRAGYEIWAGVLASALGV